MATQSTQRNGNGKEYTEDPGWGSAFHREENKPPQPSYTGTAKLSRADVEAIISAKGELQISVWPRRAKSGAKYLRFHIEPAYQGSGDADLDDAEFDGPAGESDDGAETPW